MSNIGNHIITAVKVIEVFYIAYDFCRKYTLQEEYISSHVALEIINTDQGCQYASEDWISCLKKHYIRISMYGRGRCKYNFWI